MSQAECIAAVNAALHELPSAMDTPAARMMLYAIAMQESTMIYRRQVPTGPARGLWQFEAGGGVRGVLTHKSSRFWARSALQARSISADTKTAWAALETDDVLAAIFARLLLFTDPRPLPAVHPSSGGAAWDYYIRNWRPGKPHRDRWNASFALGLELAR